MKWVEKVVKIEESGRSGKKYAAVVKNLASGATRRIHFGDANYEQFKDRTGLGHFSNRNHGDRKRRTRYYQRHSGVTSKVEGIEKERRASRGRYTPKLLSHIYLW